MQGIAKQAIKTTYSKALKATAKAGVEGGAVVGLNYATEPEDHLNNILGGLSSTALAAIPGIGPIITAIMIGGLLIDAINPAIVELTNAQLDTERRIYFETLTNIASKLGEKRPENLKIFAIPIDLTNEKDLKAYGGHLRDYIAQNNLLLGEEAIMASDALTEQLNQNRMNRFRRFSNVTVLATKDYVNKVNKVIYEEKRRIQMKRSIRPYLFSVISTSMILTCLLCVIILVGFSA